MKWLTNGEGMGDFWAILGLAFLSSLGHCSLMCGGFNLAFARLIARKNPLQDPPATPPSPKAHSAAVSAPRPAGASPQDPAPPPNFAPPPTAHAGQEGGLAKFGRGVGATGNAEDAAADNVHSATAPQPNFPANPNSRSIPCAATDLAARSAFADPVTERIAEAPAAPDPRPASTHETPTRQGIPALRDSSTRSTLGSTRCETPATAPDSGPVATGSATYVASASSPASHSAKSPGTSSADTARLGLSGAGEKAAAPATPDISHLTGLTSSNSRPAGNLAARSVFVAPVTKGIVAAPVAPDPRLAAAHETPTRQSIPALRDSSTRSIPGPARCETPATGPSDPSISGPTACATSPATAPQAQTRAATPLAPLGLILLYQLGRTASYLILGLVCGFCGSFLGLSEGVMRGVIFGLGIFMAGLGLGLFFRSLFVAWLERHHPLAPLFRRLSRLAMGLRGARAAAVLGLANGFVPCGLVYFFLAGALSSGVLGAAENAVEFDGAIGWVETAMLGAAHAGGVMLALGLGTAPVLILITRISLVLSENFQKFFTRLSCLLIIIYGLRLAWLGLRF